MTKIKKLLIANRGEIACRIARTCFEMGIVPVAIYSQADKGSLFVRLIKEAYLLDGVTPLETYLNSEKILAIAAESGVDAIHPGYGFLSENSGFAHGIAKQGLIFVGPDAETLRLMGSKQEAKKIMEKAGVPTIPGYHGDDQDEKNLVKMAMKIGLPCMVKASAGGGGKGLKKVTREDDLLGALAAAKREAKSSFDDDKLIIEKYIEKARHIEVQVFGDVHGNSVHLFERECSLQRRHQKVIEEAPSASISKELRHKITTTAIKAVKAVGYKNAGTVEFVVDGKENFYFLEMNTRLQVEHRVTEMITGLDLVKWQLLIACGEKLPDSQEKITCSGHAIEARVYAEDPFNDFLPSTGKVVFCDLYRHKDVLYDFGVESGDEVSVHYDPMIGKVIAFGKTRKQSLENLSLALQESTVLGTITNIAFLQTLIRHPDFLASRISTDFIDSHAAEFTKRTSFNRDKFIIAASLYHDVSMKNSTASPLLRELEGFRFLPSQWIHESLLCHDAIISFSYRKSGEGFDFLINQNLYSVVIKDFKEHELHLRINDAQEVFIFTADRDRVYFKSPDGFLTFSRHSVAEKAFSEGLENELLSPLPGKVLKVLIKKGESVKPQQTLLIVEAMKMEHPIKANTVATIDEIFFKENDGVKLGDVLLRLKNDRS